MKKRFFLFLLLAVTFPFACKKSDPGSSGGQTVQGNVTLSITVTHHYWNVPSIPVYIKFNATEWPGKDSTKYDIMKMANMQGIVTFDNLGQGTMMIYASGFDPIWQGWTIGYHNLNITKADANSTVGDTVVVSEKF